MRRSVAAAIAASGLAIGGAGVLIAGEGPAAGNGSGSPVHAGTVAGQGSLERDDPGGAAQPPAAPKVTNAAQAADLVLRRAGGGRVTGVQLDEVGGRAVWKVTYLVGAGQRGAQVDALTRPSARPPPIRAPPARAARRRTAVSSATTTMTMTTAMMKPMTTMTMMTTTTMTAEWPPSAARMRTRPA
jgi:hypothetical protein